MWGRVVKLEVYSSDKSGTRGEDVLVTEELRVDFSYFHEWGRNDLCSVQVFNLSRQTFKSLASNKILGIKLSAGYRDQEGDLPVLLEGFINNVWGQKIVPNHITHLYCVPKALYLAASNIVIPKTTRESTLKDHLTAIAGAMEITPPKFIGKAADQGDVVIGARSPDTTIYNELRTIGNQHKVKVLIIDKQMVVTLNPGVSGAVADAKEDPNAKVIELDTVFLRGTPKLTNSEIQIPYVLTPGIKSGDIIDVGNPSEPNTIASVADISGLGANLNRDAGIIDYATSKLYMVLTVKHTGSAFNKTWLTSITAQTYSLNTKGEINGG